MLTDINPFTNLPEGPSYLKYGQTASKALSSQPRAEQVELNSSESAKPSSSQDTYTSTGRSSS